MHTKNNAYEARNWNEPMNIYLITKRVRCVSDESQQPPNCRRAVAYVQKDAKAYERISASYHSPFSAKRLLLCNIRTGALLI